MVSIAPGTQWVSRRGRHTGNEVVVDHATDTSVFVTYKGTGDSMGNQKADPSKLHRVDRAQFESQYAPADTLFNQVNGLQPAFRQKRTIRQRAAEDTSAQPLLTTNGIVMTGDTKLNIEIMTITPEMAKVWLSRGGSNRTPSIRRVNRYAEAMRRGEWKLTGEGIKLNAQGQVRDGGQRLRAIIQSGVSIQSLVVRNIDEDAFDVLDSGRTRTTADVLGLHGFPSRNALAAAARGLILIDKFGRYAITGKEVDEAISTPIILRYAQRHRDLLVEAIHCADLLHARGFAGGIGLWGTLFGLLLRVDHEAALLFADALASGENLERDNPILRLRNRMLAERRLPNAWTDREVHIAVGIKAWNAWRRGETIQQLVWRGRNNNEPFPVPE